jgi:hypothetical protein
MAKSRSEARGGSGETADVKRGHYRAYDAHGEVIWQQDDFIVGSSRVPYGISIGMSACTITAGNKVIHRWDPRGVL